MEKKTAAILGASTDRAKFGNISLRAHAQHGYEVYPVNPSAATIEGHTCYANLADLPVEQIDRISVYLPPPILMRVLPEIATKPHQELS